MEPLSANQLRKGNWLSYHGFAVQVDRRIAEHSVGLTIYKGFNIDPGPDTLYINLHQIPLDDELITLAGGKTDDNSQNSFYIPIKGKNLSFSIYKNENSYSYLHRDSAENHPLESVHELQNAFQFFSNQELDMSALFERQFY
jgi:hypothetical protein